MGNINEFNIIDSNLEFYHVILFQHVGFQCPMIDLTIYASTTVQTGKRLTYKGFGTV